MLINEIGIDDEMLVELDSRRASTPVNPSTRISMAMVLQTAFTTFDTSDPTGAPTRRVAPVSTLKASPLDVRTQPSSRRESAA